jgi:hypothetical protein
VYTFLPAIVMSIPFGLALAFSSVAALFKGSWTRSMDRNIHALIAAAGVSIVLFVIGAGIGYLQRRKRG